MALRATPARATKWWGWGEEAHIFSLPNPGRFWAFLRERLGGTGDGRRIASLDEIALSPPRLKRGALAALRRIVGKDGLSTGTADRAVHSRGKGYRGLVRIRRGEVPTPTDAVIYPSSEGQVAALLDRAAHWGIRAAATADIIDAGCALSHHHGIGSDHRPWMGAYVGSGGVRALGALKGAFDPQGIMNPGKLAVDAKESGDV